MNHNPDTSEPVRPEPEAVAQEYGDLAGIYAKSRSETAQALGRKTSAHQWQRVEEEIQSEHGGDDNE